jgi:hypothetical protein
MQSMATGQLSPAKQGVALQAQDTNNVEAGGRQMAVMAAVMAEVNKLESKLGCYLFKGMNASNMRRREGTMSLTDAVRLHLASQAGEDFKLEVWLCRSIGEDISHAEIRLVEDWKKILGDYLFEAMKASNWRKEEEKNGISEQTSAVQVSFPSSEDSKLEVMLRFTTGKDMYTEIYPTLI